METIRKCKKCQEEKKILEFEINNTFPSGIKRKHTCKVYRYHQQKVRRELKKNHEKPEKGLCPVCIEIKSNLVMDHNHKTDEFRGWVCNECNTGMGLLDDCPKRLERARDYLKGNFPSIKG